MTFPNDPLPADSKRTVANGRVVNHRLTRRRVPLSCVACRVRKLKCNREKPCQNCVVRGESTAASCTYAEKVEKRLAGQADPRSDAEDMRKRLNRLESSILSMLTENDTPAKITSSSGASNVDTSAVIESKDQAGGQIMSQDTRSTHWDAVLSELGAMKEAWSEENDRIEYTSTVESLTAKSHRPGLLTGLTAPPDRATILSSIPPREASDKLILQFFASYNPAIPARYVLHKGAFLRQYSQHWADPSKTKIMWIGLLFSVYTIAMHSFLMANEIPPEYEGTAPAVKELYRVRTVQCLLIADITKPTEFMIETLNLHSFAEYAEERDGDMNTCLLSGLMMRLALQQGFHRDPSHHPNISIFQGEMRRRIWSAVSQHELLFSVQLGLPKALRYAEADTEPPRNLYEEELYEDMTELPPSRPWTEDTEISYQVVKYQIMRSYGRVIEFLHIISPQPYEEVLRLDLILLEVHSRVPPHLKLASLHEMRHDAPARIVERYILDIFYHKAVCILHRKYWYAVPKDSGKDTWYYSRKTCVTSAMTMLQHQETMHTACAPGGCMLPLKWYHFSITNHDFLLAAMVLCLDIMNNLHEKGETAPECIILESDKIETLKRSCAIWTEVIDDCRDAKRAERVLTAVLRKIEGKVRERDADPLGMGPAQRAGKMPQIFSKAVMSEPVDKLRYNPYFTDRFGLGQSSVGNANQSGTHSGSQSQTGSLTYSKSSPESDTFMQDGILDELAMPVDFNWDTWDQFMLSQFQGSEQNGNTYLEQEPTTAYQPSNGVERMDTMPFIYPFVPGGHLAR